MLTVSLAAQKGGVGKSTTCFNLACLASTHGRALIIDTDKQATCEKAYQRRKAVEPKLAVVKPGGVADAVAKAQGAGFDFVFIDSAGNEDAARAAIACADIAVIPCKPEIPDVEANILTASIAKEQSTPFAFLVNMAPSRGSRTTDAAEAMAAIGVVLETAIVHRVAYPDSLRTGEAAFETGNDKAAAETRALWSEIQALNDKLNWSL